MGTVRHYLVEVLLSSSLDLGPLGVKVDTNLDKGFLLNHHLLFSCDKHLLPHQE
jgi:hypothetical protein